MYDGDGHGGGGGGGGGLNEQFQTCKDLSWGDESKRLITRRKGEINQKPEHTRNNKKTNPNNTFCEPQINELISEVQLY